MSACVHVQGYGQHHMLSVIWRNFYDACNSQKVQKVYFVFIIVLEN